jgi:hypothetical protein
MSEQTSTITSQPVNSDGTFPARLFPGEAEALARIPTAPDPVAVAAAACKRDAERQAGMVQVERAVIEQVLAAIKKVPEWDEEFGCAFCEPTRFLEHEDDCPRQAAIAALERVLRGGE